MSSNGGTDVQRVRSGAKSCLECSRRKIRCIWSSSPSTNASTGTGTACEPCLGRNRPCVPQMQRTQAAKKARSTARDRIGQLEQEVAALTSAVKEHHSDGPASASRPAATDAHASSSSDGEDQQDVEESTPPSHLRLLFDDFASASAEDRDRARDRRSRQARSRVAQKARAKLQALLPSRSDVLAISQRSSQWMSLYQGLFPAVSVFRTGDQLVSSWDSVQSSSADPVQLAMYLLCIAVTVQQMPFGGIPSAFHRGSGAASFVSAVCRAVNQQIVENNTLLGTPEGLETALLYVRLALGRGNVQTTWLVFRRIVAMAEVVGLPQANEMLADRVTESNDPEHAANRSSITFKADIWEAICASDRNFSLMLNFPPATGRYRFPRDGSIYRDGRISPQAYNYRLSDICASVFEIDESFTRGLPVTASFEKALRVDRQLRELAGEAPTAWWNDQKGVTLADLLVKFWHYYILARVHLRLGMKMDPDDQYTYNRSSCRRACLQAVRRFPRFRQLVPSGFFVCGVLDVQAFTAATVLLLSISELQEGAISSGPSSEAVTAVEAVIDCFASVSDRAGSGFASEARSALETLMQLSQGKFTPQDGLRRVQIPMLGAVYIRPVVHGRYVDCPSPGAASLHPSGMHELDEGQRNYPGIPATAPDAHVVADAYPDALTSAAWSFEFNDPSGWLGSDWMTDWSSGLSSLA